MMVSSEHSKINNAVGNGEHGGREVKHISYRSLLQSFYDVRTDILMKCLINLNLNPGF